MGLIRRVHRHLEIRRLCDFEVRMFLSLTLRERRQLFAHLARKRHFGDWLRFAALLLPWGRRA